MLYPITKTFYSVNIFSILFMSMNLSFSQSNKRNEMQKDTLEIDASSLKHFNNQAPVTSVTLVVHGLNNKPEVMNPIIDWLIGNGSEVYLVKLFGHHDNSGPIQDVKKDTWYEEFHNGYYIALDRAQELGVPINFLGYSLGALVGQYAIFKNKGNIQFSKQVLWAPATAMRTTSHLLKATFFLPGKWELPSYTPKAYQANNGIPIKVYKTLFRLQKEILKGEYAYLNIPTLVIIDPKDEAISLRKLKKYQNKFGLDQYRFVELNPFEKRETKYHHLIVSQQTAGENNWSNMLESIQSFFY